MQKMITTELLSGPGEPDRARHISVAVTNGTESVPLGLSDQITALAQGKPVTSQHVALEPEEAVEIAVALILHANMAKQGKHAASQPEPGFSRETLSDAVQVLLAQQGQL